MQLSARLHHGIVLFADLDGDVWPGYILRAVVTKGHLQQAPLRSSTVDVLHGLQAAFKVLSMRKA